MSEETSRNARLGCPFECDRIEHAREYMADIDLRHPNTPGTLAASAARSFSWQMEHIVDALKSFPDA